MCLSVCSALLMNLPSSWWLRESWRPPRCRRILLYCRLSITADTLRMAEFLIMLTNCDRWNCVVTFMFPGDGKAGNCLVPGLSREPNKNCGMLMGEGDGKRLFSSCLFELDRGKKNPRFPLIHLLLAALFCFPGVSTRRLLARLAVLENSRLD